MVVHYRMHILALLPPRSPRKTLSSEYSPVAIELTAPLVQKPESNANITAVLLESSDLLPVFLGELSVRDLLRAAATCRVLRAAAIERMRCFLCPADHVVLAGAGKGPLRYPCFTTVLPDGAIIISDAGRWDHGRVLLIGEGGYFMNLAAGKPAGLALLPPAADRDPSSIGRQAPERDVKPAAYPPPARPCQVTVSSPTARLNLALTLDLPWSV